jgi:hypothetical protein
MTRTLVLDEVYLVVRIPADLPARRAQLLRRAIATARFAARLRSAARDVLARVPGVRADVRVSVRVAR